MELIDSGLFPIIQPDAPPVSRPDVSTPMLTSDAACAAAEETARIQKQPVDIIWVVDNSTSMEPAIVEVQRGLDGFARRIGSRDLDYRVIMIALRGRGRVGDRYGVCVPEPLAGDDECGDGDRFFHTSVDIRSTQPLEQILGTLGRTSGYGEGEAYGAKSGEEPWRTWLRPEATKTFVIVTDDNARMVMNDFRKPPMGDNDRNASPVATANFFEHYPGGANPFNGGSSTRMLPPGILDPMWGGIFEGYTFAAIYGFSSTGSAREACMFSRGESAASPGPTYTELVNRTSGARASICDGSRAWTTFFDEVATAVDTASRVACDIAVPTPSTPGLAVDPNLVNVILDGSTRTYLRRAPNAAACVPGAWYFDDPRNPTRVNLCPATCMTLQQEVRTREATLRVEFGCNSIPI